jgi:hypothetical protein
MTAIPHPHPAESRFAERPAILPDRPLAAYDALAAGAQIQQKASKP